MAITPFKTFLAGEVLTAADLNSSFTRITENGSLLGWPAASSKDMDGYPLILDTGGSSSLQASTNNLAKFILSSKDLFFWDGTVASPVNGMTATASATGNAVSLAATGDDTNIDFNLSGKGSGVVNIGGVAFVDWESSGAEQIDDSRISETSVTQHEGAIDHDSLTNFVAEEHIRWDQSGAEDIANGRIPESAVTQHETAIDHDALTNFVAEEHIRWDQAGVEDIANGRIAESAVTQHETAIDHDALLNFVAQEHIRWDQTGPTQLHDDRVQASNVTQHEGSISHDNLSGFVAAEHIDWSSSGITQLHDSRVSSDNVTQHEGDLSIDASQVSGTFTGSFDLNGAGSLIGDSDGNSTIHATVNNRWDFATAGVDRMQLDTSTLLMGVTLDMNGNVVVLDPDGDTSISSTTDDALALIVGGSTRLAITNSTIEAALTLDMDGEKIDLDADADTSIHASTDDRIDFEVGGSDRVRMTTTQLDLVNVDLDMNGNDITTSSGDVTIEGVVMKRTRAATASTQNISNTTETDLTNLTGVLLPTTSSVNTKTFEARGVVQCTDAGVGSRNVIIRVYNGSTGDKDDTLVGTFQSFVPALGSFPIPFSVTFSPGASSRTRVGLSAQLSSSVSTNFNPSRVSTLILQEVIE